MALGISVETNEGGAVTIVSGKLPRTIREHKGSSLTDLVDDYVVLDLETTGLDPSLDEIIEMAAIKVKQNSVVSTFQTLVKPKSVIDSFIIELTGITNEMVKDAPNIKQALPDLIKFIGNDIVIGHNVNFDINFLYDDCIWVLDKPFTNDFIDTLRFSRKLFNDVLPNHQLGTIANHFKIKIPIHRALGDCEAVNAFYKVIHEYVIENEKDLKQLFSLNSQKKASKITTDKTDFNFEHPMYDKFFVFTGKLEKMIRSEAQQIVVDLGGHCTDNVTVNTNYLILGNLDYSTSKMKDKKSGKLKKAETLILKGQALEIISENVFYDMIS